MSFSISTVILFGVRVRAGLNFRLDLGIGLGSKTALCLH